MTNDASCGDAPGRRVLFSVTNRGSDHPHLSALPAGAGRRRALLREDQRGARGCGRRRLGVDHRCRDRARFHAAGWSAAAAGSGTDRRRGSAAIPGALRARRTPRPHAGERAPVRRTVEGRHAALDAVRAGADRARRRRPDGAVALVHAAGLPYSSVLFAGVRLAERARAALVVTPFTHVPPPGSPASLFRRAYLSPLNLRLIARADRVCVQTALERRVLEEHGIPPERLVEVGQGVDVEACTGGDRARGRHRWTLNPHRCRRRPPRQQELGQGHGRSAGRVLRRSGRAARRSGWSSPEPRCPASRERWARVTARDSALSISGPLSATRSGAISTPPSTCSRFPATSNRSASARSRPRSTAPPFSPTITADRASSSSTTSTARLVAPGDMDAARGQLELLVRDAGTRTRLARRCGERRRRPHLAARASRRWRGCHAEARRAHSRS